MRSLSTQNRLESAERNACVHLHHLGFHLVVGLCRVDTPSSSHKIPVSPFLDVASVAIPYTHPEYTNYFHKKQRRKTNTLFVKPTKNKHFVCQTENTYILFVKRRKTKSLFVFLVCFLVCQTYGVWNGPKQDVEMMQQIGTVQQYQSEMS